MIQQSEKVTTKKPKGITSITRAANILLCLSNGMNTVTEIAACCQYSKPTVHRLLKALEVASLVTQGPVNRRYYLGKLITLISYNPQTTHHYLVECSIEEIKRLSDMSEENVVLGIHAGVQFVRLCGIPSKHDLRFLGQIREMGVPCFAGSISRALLSQYKDKELEIMMRHVELEPVTKHTITDKAIYLRRIELTRQHGYDVCYGEVFDGIMDISAPIRNYSCPAALSVVGPEYRLKTRETEVIKELRISAARISNNIRESISFSPGKTTSRLLA